MQNEQTTYEYFALSLKGEFYAGWSRYGQLTSHFFEAMIFETEQDAEEHRKEFDHRHKVDCSTLLKVQILVSES